MVQNRFSWLVSALLLSVAAPSFAETAHTPADAKGDATMPSPVVQQTYQNQALAHKMMGHINLAQMALDLGLPSEAARQVERAQNLQETLQQQMPELRLDSSFKYGKVTYDGKSVLTDHYIPVIDDVFLVSDYAEILKRANVVDTKELSAGVMHVGISVDLDAVRSALDRADLAIKSTDYAAARKSLDDVFRDAIVDEEEVSDPKLLIAENLALAKSFVDQGQYDSARLTLKHVQDRLAQARTHELAGIDKASLDKFSTELDGMRADLRTKDPTLTQSVSDHLANLAKTITGWFG